MKHTASQTRRLILTKNFIMMLVVLALIVMACFAWFSFTKTVDASNICVKATSAEIDIAPCVKTFNQNGTVATDGPGEFGSLISFDFSNEIDYLTDSARTQFSSYTKDCTGDGKDLIVPEFNITKDYESVRKNGGKEVNVNLGPATAKSNLDTELSVRQHPDQDPPEYQYIALEFYVRSKNKELMLQPDARVISETEVGGHSISYVPDAKKSSYGNFNVDSLVGAIRVALVGEACTSVNQSWSYNSSLHRNVITSTNVQSRRTAEKQLLWLPRPDVFLDLANTEERDVTNWPLRTGVTASQYNGASYKASYYVDNHSGGVNLVENDQNAVKSTGTYTSSNVTVPSLGTAVNITNFSYSDELDPISLVVDNTNNTVTDYYYVTKYTLKVWIEGTDAEARRAMDGGRFNVILDFG